MSAPHIQLLPLVTAVPANQALDLPVLIRITAPQAEQTTPRPPLNLALAIDRSGSMSGDKIRTAQQAAQAVIDLLLPTDRVSIVTFDNVVETLLPSTPVVDSSSIKSVIDSITPRGSTALHGGWLQAGLNVSDYLQPGALNRVLLLSDGQANIGKRDPDGIAEDVKGLAERGISTSSFGMGDDYDEVLLESVALAGDGNYVYIEQLDQLTPVLAAELGGLQATRGRLVSLGLEPDSELDVSVVDVLNDLRRTDTGRLKLPNLVGGVPVEAVVKLHVSGKSVEAGQGQVSPLRVRLAWTDPESGKRQVLRASLDLPVVTPEAAGTLMENAEVRDRVTALTIARQKDEAVRSLDRGDLRAARESLRWARQTSAKLRDRSLASLEQARLDALEGSLDSGEYARARKQASSQSFDRKRRG